MNLDKLRQKTEEYRNGLEQAAHQFDEFKQIITEKMQIFDAEDLPAEEKKVMEEAGCAPIPKILSALNETKKALLLSVSASSLGNVLKYYDSQGKTMISLSENCDIDSEAQTPREIFRLIKQLPKYDVIDLLDIICRENDSFALLDAFKQDNENGFVIAFEQLKEKHNTIDRILSFAQKHSLIPMAMDLLKEAPIEREDYTAVLNDIDIAAPVFNNILSGIGLQQLNLDELYSNGTPLMTQQDAETFYKKILLSYLRCKPKMDDYTIEVAEKIIQNPDHLDIVNKLLVECEEIIKKESMGEESQYVAEKDELKPFPFPHNIINIEPKQVKPFLERLYEKLLNSDGKQYLEKGRKDLFIYLFGGSEEQPDQCVPLVWLRQKNELQALLLALFGDEAGKDPGWSTFDNYFRLKIKNKIPELANSSGGNISSDIKDRFKKLVNGIKTGFISNPN